MTPSLTSLRIALTGATGFVGHHAASQLVQAGATVVALVRSSSKIERLSALRIPCIATQIDVPSSVAEAVRGCDAVIHTAGAVDFGEDWQHLRNMNVGGTRGVIEGARFAGVRRVVHISSIVAVGSSERPTPLDETAKWNLGPLRVPYATTKREGEELALAANDQNLDVIVVNPGCVLGPDDFSGSEFGSLSRRFWRGQVPLSFTGGNNFVDVRDVADGILRAVKFGRPGERYLLTGENLRLSAFFTALAKVSHRTHPRITLPAWLAPPLAHLIQRFETKKPGRRPLLSVSQAKLFGSFFYFTATKAQRELGFHPRPFSETLVDAHRFWTGAKAAERSK